jgi:squalene-hopene/tetraprenyl-beta-curcumene cyclase
MRLAPPAASLPPLARAAFLGDLALATARLRGRLQDRIDPDGAVRDPCRSRVLESALLLALLDRTRLEPAARRRLAAYLAAHLDSPRPLDRLLARAALHARPAAADRLDIDQFLAQAPGFTGARKRALLHAVLLLLDHAPATEPPVSEAFCLRGLHPWARVQVTAVKTILAHCQPHLIDGRDLELLRSTQRTGTVWEGNLLIHLSVLHALAPLPGQHRLIAGGIRTALRHQRANGGMPFICDEDTWVTATAGVALHAAAAPAPVLNAIARRLLSLQQPGGGWSYTQGARLADVDCTSVAVEVLHLTGPDTHRTPIYRAIGALHALRGPDGGFPTYLAGAPSEACMTAAAANALSTQGLAEHAEVEAALCHLARQQQRDGSFPPDWSSSRHHTVFRAVLAASRHPSAAGSPAQHITQRATRLVLDSQNSDGGWGQQDGDPSDAISTAYALITLSGHHAPGPAVRGAAYLLTRQRPDGSIDSVPDSIGPRPFGFTVPVLADVFALLALGHLTRRLAPRHRRTGHGGRGGTSQGDSVYHVGMARRRPPPPAAAGVRPSENWTAIVKKNSHRSVTPATLHGAVCLVTGGAQGIGLAVTRALAQHSAHVHVAEICQQSLESAAAELQAAGLGPQVTFHHVDVSDRDAYEHCIADVHAAGGRLDILVNNAAFTRWRDVQDMSVEEAQLTMRTGYDAMVYGVKAVLPLMQAAGGGHIVTMGSAAGVVFVKGPSAAYAAAKAAINAYTQILSGELAASPVHVMLVRPGTVGGTDFFGRHVPSHRMPRIADFLPISTPEQVADAIVDGLLHQREIVDVPGYLRTMYRAYALAPRAVRTLASLGGPARRNHTAPATPSPASPPQPGAAMPPVCSAPGTTGRPSGARRLLAAAGAHPVFVDVMAAVSPPLDRAIHAITAGRSTMFSAILPTLMLQTTGRTSGQPRRTPSSTPPNQPVTCSSSPATSATPGTPPGAPTSSPGPTPPSSVTAAPLPLPATSSTATTETTPGSSSSLSGPLTPTTPTAPDATCGSSDSARITPPDRTLPPGGVARLMH